MFIHIILILMHQANSCMCFYASNRIAHDNPQLLLFGFTTNHPFAKMFTHLANNCVKNDFEDKVWLWTWLKANVEITYRGWYTSSQSHRLREAKAKYTRNAMCNLRCAPAVTLHIHVLHVAKPLYCQVWMLPSSCVFPLCTQCHF